MAEEPTYFGNVIFLIGAFFISGIATAIIAGMAVPLVGLEDSIWGYGIGISVFIGAFIVLLAFYNYYYLSE